MSTNLRDIAEEYRQVQELADDPDMPEQALIDTLEGITGTFKEKAVNIVHVLTNKDAYVESIDAEIARLQKRKRTFQNGQQRLKDYLRVNMEATGIKKIEHELFRIILLPGRESVVIDNKEVLPDDYVVVKTETRPDKIEIKKAIAEGKEVPGAHVERGPSSVRFK